MQIATDIGKQFDLKVGDEVFVPCRNRGGHGAWIEITKLKRKTFEGVERKGSYKPGMEWNVHINSCFAIVVRELGKPWVKYWVNDR